MDWTQLRNDQLGVTPVVGILLLLSITVLLAATVGAFVVGMDDEEIQQQAPTVAVEFEYAAHDGPTDDELRIVHDAGGSLDKDQTDVVVSGATCTSPSVDPNGRYNVAADFGEYQNLAAGMSVTLKGDIPTAGPKPCENGTLNLAAASVTVVWSTADGVNSKTVATWHGPDAST